ncbi:MarR family transcriptional regulator [Novosphingobium sp. RD2P27]|uniref:HTH-type transcriptional regulator n=1 Tax=Novosphingobium kalidii TaxID=3230299 RepID=A0ABV2D4P7_9SPHN
MLTKQNEKAIDRFVERLGLMSERNGSTRTLGRIFAILMTADRPLSFSEIAQRLQISRGGMSMNARSLVEQRLIERVSLPGERQDYFQLPQDLWRRLFERRMRQDKELFDTTMQLMNEDASLSADVRKDLDQLTRVLQLSLEARSKLMETLSVSAADPE